MASAQVYHAVGKRKSSVARIYLKNGNGRILINEREFGNYFPEHFRSVVKKPFDALKLNDKYDVTANISGGGTSSQADAMMYGIAKALILVSEDYRPPLKKARMLTRDSRVVERKKYGHKKARKSFQFSKR